MPSAGICRFFVAAVLLLANCSPRVRPGLVDGYYRVSRVVDGDTIELHNVGKLRFADIDAPELKEPGGPEAAEALREKIEGQVVWVEFERRKRDGMPVHGYYGRLIGTYSRRPPQTEP